MKGTCNDCGQIRRGLNRHGHCQRCRVYVAYCRRRRALVLAVVAAAAVTVLILIFK